MLHRSRVLAAAALAAAAGAVAATPASAGLQSDCNSPASSQVFAPWLDPAVYFLAPDGGFEAGGAGWDLGGSVVGDGNESYDLSGPGVRSLHMTAGDAATSPPVCVGIEHPTFRFMVRKVSGPVTATLGVKVLTAGGTAIPVGSVTGNAAWQPSPVMVIGANLLPLVLGSDSTKVRFRVTASSGSWQVDDVYVDPWGSR